MILSKSSGGKSNSLRDMTQDGGKAEAKAKASDFSPVFNNEI
jgi:hypothetical protein